MSREQELEELRKKAENGEKVITLKVEHLNDDDLSIIESFPNLESLQLWSCKLSNECTQYLKNLKKLSRISAYNNEINIDGIKNLAQSPLCSISLETINLNQNAITVLNSFSNTLSKLSIIDCENPFNLQNCILNLPKLDNVRLSRSIDIHSLSGIEKLDTLVIEDVEEGELALLKNMKIQLLRINFLENSDRDLSIKLPNIFSLTIWKIDSISEKFWSNFPRLEELLCFSSVVGDRSYLKQIREFESFSMRRELKVGEDLKQMANLKRLYFMRDEDADCGYYEYYSERYKDNYDYPTKEEWALYLSLPQVLAIRVRSIFQFDLALPIEVRDYIKKHTLDYNGEDDNFEKVYEREIEGAYDLSHESAPDYRDVYRARRRENYYGDEYVPAYNAVFLFLWRLKNLIFEIIEFVLTGKLRERKERKKRKKLRLAREREERLELERIGFLGLSVYDDGESEPESCFDDYLPDNYRLAVNAESTLECAPQMMLHIEHNEITYRRNFFDEYKEFGGYGYAPRISERIDHVKADLARYHCLPKATRLCLENFEYRGNAETIIRNWSRLQELRMIDMGDHRKSFWWHLVNYTSLKKLHLDSVEVFQQMWLALKEVENLELSLFSVTEKTPDYQFAKMKDLSLKKLHLGKRINFKSVLQHFDSWKTLEELHISEDLEEDWSLLAGKKIKSLHLCDIWIGEDSWEKIAKVAAERFHFSHCKEKYIEKDENVDYEEELEKDLGVEAIKKVESLLGEYHLQLDPEPDPEKDNPRQWNYFNEDWSIATWAISDKFLIKHIDKISMKKLVKVSLNAPRVDDDLVAKIVEKSKLLTSVDLSNTYISKKAIESLSTLENLRVLNLYNSSVGVDCLGLLKEMELESLNVERTDLDGLI